jgi:hypothetical protein
MLVVGLEGCACKERSPAIRTRVIKGTLVLKHAVKSKRSERKLPIDPILMVRIEKLGKDEWVFRSRTGTPPSILYIPAFGSSCGTTLLTWKPGARCSWLEKRSNRRRTSGQEFPPA